jgi:ABC-type phosphate/phosphonate transport system ATPase subunit
MKPAPPIILMDDPVSHVDDLNMRVFLDVIREIVVSDVRRLHRAARRRTIPADSGIMNPSG